MLFTELPYLSKQTKGLQLVARRRTDHFERGTYASLNLEGASKGYPQTREITPAPQLV